MDRTEKARQVRAEREICPCGQPFTPRRKGQRFCSAICRAKAWKQAHPEIVIGEINGMVIYARKKK